MATDSDVELSDGLRRLAISTDGNKYTIESMDMSMAEVRDFCKTFIEQYGYRVVK